MTVEDQYVILENIVYSYEVVRLAAAEVQKKDKWKEIRTVQDLKFSDHWIHDFLSRQGFSRRRCTRENKQIPSKAKIDATMKENQKLFIVGVYCKKTTVNMDETAYNYAIGPSYLYVPQDSVRAGHAVGTDIKLHTTAVLAADATGEFLSPFIVIKHSAKKR